MTSKSQEVLDQEYKQPKDNFNKNQEKALKLIIAKQDSIKKTEREIDELLRNNNLNNLDLDKYKHDKNVDKFLATEFPH